MTEFVVKCTCQRCGRSWFPREPGRPARCPAEVVDRRIGTKKKPDRT